MKINIKERRITIENIWKEFNDKILKLRGEQVNEYKV